MAAGTDPVVRDRVIAATAATLITYGNTPDYWLARLDPLFRARRDVEGTCRWRFRGAHAEPRRRARALHA